MGFLTAIKTVLREYATFSGRASRSEYWWFVLFMFLGTLAASIVDAAIFGVGTPEQPAAQLVTPLFSLAILLPLLAVGWRRLHDTGRPGWYLLIPLFVSLIAMIGMTAGIFGFAELEKAGFDEGTLRTAAGGIGMTGVAVIGIAQLVVALLLLWWLTRPSQTGPNQYGEEPS